MVILEIDAGGAPCLTSIWRREESLVNSVDSRPVAPELAYVPRYAPRYMRRVHWTSQS